MSCPCLEARRTADVASVTCNGHTHERKIATQQPHARAREHTCVFTAVHTVDSCNTHTKTQQHNMDGNMRTWKCHIMHTIPHTATRIRSVAHTRCHSKINDTHISAANGLSQNSNHFILHGHIVYRLWAVLFNPRPRCRRRRIVPRSGLGALDSKEGIHGGR